MRLLSATRGSSSRGASSNRKSDKHKPELIFHLPGFGIQYLAVPPPRDDLEAQRQATREMKGDLEVRMPVDMGIKRAKRLRIGLKTLVRLAMGDGRGWEEDVVYETEYDLGTMLYLHPGSNRYPFSFMLEPYMPPHDWHPEANLRHVLWAELEGTHTTSSLLPKALRIATRSPSTSRAPSRQHSPIASPAHSPIGSRASSPTRTGRSMPMPDLARLTVDELPRVPSYEQSEMEAHRNGGNAGGPSSPLEDVPALEGVYKNSRHIRVAFNPSNTGGTVSLDDRLEGTASGLGSYKVHLRSPLWVVNAFLYTRLRIKNIPPSVTIYDVRININQTVSLSSPRDPVGVTVPLSRTFCIYKDGLRPGNGAGADFPALWKGKQAGGGDESDWTVETKARVPDDTELRPTTLDGVNTPINVQHQIAIEVTFAVWGETADGKPLGKAGPGEPRRLKVSRVVIVPSCKNIPQVIGLPSYETTPSSSLALPNTPCPMCKVEPMDRACTTCAFDVPTHPRHDHPPKVVGTADGTCPVCSVLMTQKDTNLVVCACALSDEDLEALGAGLLEPGSANAMPAIGAARRRAWSMSSALWREADAGGMGEVRGQKEEYEYDHEDRGRDRTRR